LKAVHFSDGSNGKQAATVSTQFVLTVAYLNTSTGSGVLHGNELSSSR